MKTSKLLDRLGRLMDGSNSADKQHIKKLCLVVKALKHKQKKLEQQLHREEDKEVRAGLRRGIEVIRAQRRKGADAYKALKKARKAARQGTDGTATTNDVVSLSASKG
jgi:hypothetical protein